MESDVVRANEVMVRLECSAGKAYAIIKALNEELEAQGYVTISGRVPRAYFEEKCRLGGGRDAIGA